MFEEIRLEGESVSATIHPRIVITEAAIPTPTHVEHWLSKASGTFGHRTGEVIPLLRELVPEYAELEAVPSDAVHSAVGLPVMQTDYAV